MRKLVLFLVAVFAVFTFIRDFTATPLSASAAVRAEISVPALP